LEFARNCAAGFNHVYGKILVEPETILSPAKRVMSLQQPSKKMSKSDANPKSRIMITDSRDEIARKIKSAVTDSEEGITYEPEARPGISNLLEITYHLDEAAAGSLENLVQDCKNLSKRAFKEKVSTTIADHLEPIRERYNELIHRDEGSLLSTVAEEGAAKAAALAKGTMAAVRNAVGLS
jgi:tryptophanyl-tRNA synthetase